jgi:hypothetical protein
MPRFNSKTSKAPSVECCLLIVQVVLYLSSQFVLPIPFECPRFIFTITQQNSNITNLQNVPRVQTKFLWCGHIEQEIRACSALEDNLEPNASHLLRLKDFPQFTGAMDEDIPWLGCVLLDLQNALMFYFSNPKLPQPTPRQRQILVNLLQVQYQHPIANLERQHNSSHSFYSQFDKSRHTLETHSVV